MTARKKPALSVRIGHVFGKYVPGASKKLGRTAKRAATTTAKLSKEFSRGVAQGWREA